jgi:class 3 adenylate cyclase
VQNSEIESAAEKITDTEPVNSGEERFSPRIPIRWRWTVLVGVAIAVSVGFLYLVILDMQHDAWLKNQAEQAEVHVNRLVDELKLHMLSGNTTETALIVEHFLDKVPAVLGVLIQHAPGKDHREDIYYELDDKKKLIQTVPNAAQIKSMEAEALWHAKPVVFSGTEVGRVGVRFSEKSWDDMAGHLASEMLVATIVVVILSSLMVFWIAGRMSQPLEMLAHAARQVAAGDYHIRLPVRGNDEMTDAVSQFNVMVGELEHKKELRKVFDRYLNPKLVSDVFEDTDMKVENHRQEVTVLFADMVGFTSFSESTDIENVISVLNSHFEVFHRVITYYGGHVDKYIGDAVMAVFNHPVDDPKHARHAAKAGLAMNIACQELGLLHANGEPISFKIGLNCGQAIVCNIGAAKRLEYTVIGDSVNVASRMGGLGEGGEVVMSSATFERLGEGFVYDSIGVRDIKGVSQSMECGVIRSENADVRRDILHAVDLAFEQTLPEDIHQISGDI